jgi:hypothetical protein
MFLGHVAVGLAAKRVAPKAPLVGLATAATLAVEGTMVAFGVRLYGRTTVARDGVGRWSFAAFVVLLVIIYLGNVFGPPPPSVEALKVVAFAGFLVPVWAGWFDRHRVVRTSD